MELNALNSRIEALHRAARFEEAVPLAADAISQTMKLFERGSESIRAYVVKEELERAAQEVESEGTLMAEPPLGTREVLLQAPPPLSTSLQRVMNERFAIGAVKRLCGMGLQFAIELDNEQFFRNAAQSLRLASYLAECHYRQGDLQKSAALFQQVRVDCERAFNAKHRLCLQASNNQAVVLLAQGKPRDALALAQSALAVARASLSATDALRSMLLANQARMQTALGAYAGAAIAWREWLASVGSAEKVHPMVRAEALIGIGIGRMASGELEAALEPLAAARALQGEILALQVGAGTQDRRLRYLGRHRWLQEVLVAVSLQHRDVRAFAGLAADTVLQSKGRILETTVGASSAPEAAALRAKLAAVHEKRAALSADPVTRGLYDLVLRGEQARLEAAMAALPAARPSPATSETTARSIQRLLPPGSLLVEYARVHTLPLAAKRPDVLWDEPHYVAIVITSDAEVRLVDLGASKGIDNLVSEFLAALKTPSSSFVREVAADLYKSVVGPWKDALGETVQVFLTPDGALSLIPFAALVDERGSWVAQRREINYLNTGRDLQALQSEPPPPCSGPVVIADPEFGEFVAPPPNPGSRILREVEPFSAERYPVPSQGWRRLAGTAREASLLQGFFDGQAPQILTGPRADKAGLSRVSGPRVLHIATHGFFRPGNEVNGMYDSGLVLTGANTAALTARTRGFITSAEVALLDLKGTSLAVLSACDSGVGGIAVGEGVFGLRRALSMAGARSLVVSLWRIEDQASVQMVDALYARLKTGASPASALRQVQQAWLKERGLDHPFFWAMFVTIGDWRPVFPPTVPPAR